MGFRIGRRLVPSSTIQHRMNMKDARFQADARRREAARHASQPYQLPDGRIVPIRADLARGALLVSFTLEGGRIVDAVRVDGPR